MGDETKIFKVLKESTKAAKESNTLKFLGILIAFFTANAGYDVVDSKINPQAEVARTISRFSDEDVFAVKDHVLSVDKHLSTTERVANQKKDSETKATLDKVTHHLQMHTTAIDKLVAAIDDLAQEVRDARN